MNEKQAVFNRYALLEIAVVFSLVNLSFLLVYREIIFAAPSDSYYLPDFTKSTYIAIILNVILITSMLSIFWTFAKYSRNKMLITFSRIIFFVLMIFPLNYVRVSMNVNSRQVYWLIDHPITSLFLVLLLALVSWFIIKKHLVLFTRIVAGVLLILSPFGLISLGHAAWRAATAPTSSSRPWSPEISVEGHTGPQKERVVWLMFDELDLRLAFTERPEGVALPEFDRFRRSALFATNGNSHSKDTLEAIPSYLVEKIVSRARPESGNTLMVGLEGSEEGSLQDFRSLPSFFDELKPLGLKACIVGFYHPYHRLFKDVCPSSYGYSMGSYCIRTTNSVLAEMVSQLIGVTPVYKRINAIKTYESILEDTKRLVKDPGYDVVFVHAPVPHGPDVYDGHSDSFSPFIFSKAGYFGNLELADRFLAEIRSELEQANLWNRTSVLITSDHEWRHVHLYDNVRTRKVPFLLKLRNQTEPDVFPEEFSPMLVTKTLLIRLLKGELVSKEGLVRCIRQG